MNPPDLKRFVILAHLTDEERVCLSDVLAPRELADGEELFREGDPAEGMVLVAAGCVRLASRRAGDLGSVAEGAVLGGASLVSVGPREATATAVGPTRIFCLGRAGYQRLVSDAPRVACRLLEGVLQQLAEATRESLDRLARER